MAEIIIPSMLAVGTVLNGKYRIERHLSSGGFGNTYMATNLTFNDVVAVKEFFMRGISQRDGDSITISVSNSENRELFTEQLEKFKKEAQRIRQLRSQHIVRVHDLFEANGTAYYVMDYIDGESLGARLKRTNIPFTEAETRKYLNQVLEALETIHNAGLCHMDLKPENIMVDKNDNAILIDFGASKRSDNERFTSTVSGVSYTNGYAPPEQLEQDTAHFGPWTDIYALGATLYKLLTNRKPPMPSAIYSDPSPDKSSSLPFPMGVSNNLRLVILQMMAVRWNERPQSVAALRTMLAQPSYEAQTMIKTANAASKESSKEDQPAVGHGYEKADKSTRSSIRVIYGLIGALVTVVAVLIFILFRGGQGSETDNETNTSGNKSNTVTAVQKDVQETVNTEERRGDSFNSLNDAFLNTAWHNTEYGFKVPDIMNSPSEVWVENISGFVYTWNYKDVNMCYCPVLGAWAIEDYPKVGSYITENIKVKNITYTSGKRAVFSGYTDDGRIWYMRRRISEGVSTYSVSFLVVIYPESMKAISDKQLIDTVYRW